MSHKLLDTIRRKGTIGSMDEDFLKTLDTIGKALGCDGWDSLMACFREAVREMGGRDEVLALGRYAGTKHSPQEILAFLESCSTKQKIKARLAATRGANLSPSKCREARMEFKRRLEDALGPVQSAIAVMGGSLGGRKAGPPPKSGYERKLQGIMASLEEVGEDRCGRQRAKEILAGREGLSVRQIERKLRAERPPSANLPHSSKGPGKAHVQRAAKQNQKR